eukprot:UN00439
MRLLEQGIMTVYIGGPKWCYDEVKTIYDSNFQSQFYMGDVGCATITKVLSNMLAGAHTVLSAEAVMLAEKSGIDLEKP